MQQVMTASEATSVRQPTEAGATRAAKRTPSWLMGARVPGAPARLQAPKPKVDRDRGAYVSRLKLAIDRAMERAGQTDRCDPYRNVQVGAFRLLAIDGRRALLVRETGGTEKPQAAVLGTLPPASIELRPEVSLMTRRMLVCADPKDRWSGVVTIDDGRLTMTVRNLRDGIEASEWLPIETGGARFRFAIDLQLLDEGFGLWPLRLHFGNSQFVVLSDAADTVRYVVQPMALDASQQLEPVLPKGQRRQAPLPAE